MTRSQISVSNVDVTSPKAANNKQYADSIAYNSNFKEKCFLNETTLNKLQLQFNERNLVKLIDLPNQLSGAEKEIMQDKVRQEKINY